MAFLAKKKHQVDISEQVSGTVPHVAVAKRQTVEKKLGDTVRISFRMGKSLHTRLKLASVRQGRTIVSMLEGFVTEHTPIL
jgi:hypothetical protein